MFFGYFLNIKKVTPSADFVISPAKAGAFRFFHTRLPLSPRRLLPFGRISPAAKPGWPVTGPAFWVCRAKSRAAFRCAKPPWPMFWPAPLSLRSSVAPRPTTRRLSPFGSISPAAKPRWPVIGPTFWVCRAKSGAAFRRAKRPGAVCPLRGHGFATPHRSFAVPSRLRRAGSPTAKPRRLLPFGCISPAAKPRGRLPAPPGPLFPHFCPARL